MTYETDVASGDDKRNAGNSNEREFPAVCETNSRATNQAGNALHDSTESYASKTIDLLRVVRERGGKSTSLHQNMSKQYSEVDSRIHTECLSSSNQPISCLRIARKLKVLSLLVNLAAVTPNKTFWTAIAIAEIIAMMKNLYNTLSQPHYTANESRNSPESIAIT